MAIIEVRGLDELIRGLADLRDNNMNFAIAKTLTDIAWIAKSKTVTEMQSVFDRPTSFTLNSLRVDRATKQNLKSRVWFKPVNALRHDHYIVPQVASGKRRFKPFEGRLLSRGILPRDYYTVPASGADLDGYGNMKGGQITQILSFFDSFSEAGYDGNMGAAGRARLGRATSRRYGISYFAIQPNSNSHLKPGIYKRINSNFGSAVKPVLLFFRNVTYRQKLNIQRIADKTYAENFNDLFSQNFTNAVNASLPR